MDSWMRVVVDDEFVVECLEYKMDSKMHLGIVSIV